MMDVSRDTSDDALRKVLAITGFMSEGEVVDALLEHCSPQVVARMPRRMEPDGEHPGDKVFRMPIPSDDPERFMVVSFMFGQPDADAEENWRARWVCVEGPATREELESR